MRVNIPVKESSNTHTDAFMCSSKNRGFQKISWEKGLQLIIITKYTQQESSAPLILLNNES